jgi:hypothetical protein
MPARDRGPHRRRRPAPLRVIARQPNTPAPASPAPASLAPASPAPATAAAHARPASPAITDYAAVVARVPVLRAHDSWHGDHLVAVARVSTAAELDTISTPSPALRAACLLLAETAPNRLTACAARSRRRWFDRQRLRRRAFAAAPSRQRRERRRWRRDRVVTCSASGTSVGAGRRRRASGVPGAAHTRTPPASPTYATRVLARRVRTC